MASWIKVSIGLATFSFINLVLFIVLANPFNMILEKIDDEASVMDDSNVPSFSYESKVAPFLDNLATLFGLMFLFSFVGLIIWFFLGAHREEFEESPYQGGFGSNGNDYYNRGGGGFEG